MSQYIKNLYAYSEKNKDFETLKQISSINAIIREINIELLHKIENFSNNISNSLFLFSK